MNNRKRYAEPEEEESLSGTEECVTGQHLRPCRVLLSGNRESGCPGEVLQGERPAQAEGRKARMT